jgi:hypothetical protein
MPFLSNHPTISDNWSVLFYVFGALEFEYDI